VEGVLVRDLDDLVADRTVVGVRPEVLAHTLHKVRSPGPSRVDRALGVGADDAHPPAGGLLEIAAGSEIVPPVPTPATKWVIRPPVCSHSSGPVVS
jgi:hypothetical protein